MPWKECHVMDERLRFVARLLEGEKMAPLCAEFGISRKTGYKIFDRYKDCGVAAFTDRSRRPYRQANRLPAPIEAMIVRLKREYPGWGAPKIREKLRQQFTGAAPAGHQHGPCGARSARPGETPAPAAAPAPRGHRALAADRAECALVRRLQRRIHARQSAVLLPADDHRLRQPLPADLRGAARRRRRNSPSRSSSAPSRNSACRTRSGPTTACRSRRPTRSTASASCRCGGCGSGFRSSGSNPAIPQQNGRHERMHLTLKKEATKPAAANVLQQQARFDAFVDAATTRSGRIRRLAMKVPGRRLRALTARLSRPRGARPTRSTTRPSR